MSLSRLTSWWLPHVLSVLYVLSFKASQLWSLTTSPTLVSSGRLPDAALSIRCPCCASGVVAWLSWSRLFRPPWSILTGSSHQSRVGFVVIFLIRVLYWPCLAEVWSSQQTLECYQKQRQQLLPTSQVTPWVISTGNSATGMDLPSLPTSIKGNLSCLLYTSFRGLKLQFFHVVSFALVLHSCPQDL